MIDSLIKVRKVSVESGQIWFDTGNNSQRAAPPFLQAFTEQEHSLQNRDSLYRTGTVFLLFCTIPFKLCVLQKHKLTLLYSAFATSNIYSLSRQYFCSNPWLTPQKNTWQTFYWFYAIQTDTNGTCPVLGFHAPQLLNPQSPCCTNC